MSIGETLKQARSDAKLSQEAAAEKIGVSRQTISSWENDRSYPDIANVIALSDAYNVTLDSLLKGDSALVKHLKESTKKDYKQIFVIFIAFVLFMLSTWFTYTLLGGRTEDYIDLPTWLSIIFPILFILTVTRKFRLFRDGLLAAFFPQKELAKEQCVQAASLFKLLSKTTAMAAALCTLISVINMGYNIDLSYDGVINAVPHNLAMALIAPFCGIILIMFIFEPAAYILKHKSE